MTMRPFQILAFLLVLSATAFAFQNEEWTRPFPPFRMIGNIYWVGSYDLASYLINTQEGNIIVNTGMIGTAQQIRKSVEQLGFKLADTKILTATHGHFDHAAGMAELKRLTGAKLIVPEQDRGKINLVFSAHGTPMKLVQSGDPYQQQIIRTYEAVIAAGKFGLRHHLCYQSKVGPQRWLEPSLTGTIERLAAEKATHVIAIPIALRFGQRARSGKSSGTGQIE